MFVASVPVPLCVSLILLLLQLYVLTLFHISVIFYSVISIFYPSLLSLFLLIFKNPHLKICLERENMLKREREEKESEKNIDQLPFIHVQRGSNQNLVMCPDEESNLQPFSEWDNIPTN